MQIDLANSQITKRTMSATEGSMVKQAMTLSQISLSDSSSYLGKKLVAIMTVNLISMHEK